MALFGSGSPASTLSWQDKLAILGASLQDAGAAYQGRPGNGLLMVGKKLKDQQQYQALQNAVMSQPGTPGKSGADINPAFFQTPLNPGEEDQFQAWKAQYAPQDSGADYDLRGAFKAGLKPDPQTGHWPDTYKMPNHPTFSDQSQYAPGYAAGSWNGDQYMPPKAQSQGMAGGLPPQLAQLLPALGPELGTQLLMSTLTKENTPLVLAKGAKAVTHSGQTIADNPDAPKYGSMRVAVNPATQKPELVVFDEQGSPKFTGITPPPEIMNVNGQLIDKNTAAPGTVIPQQQTPGMTPQALAQRMQIAKAGNASSGYQGQQGPFGGTGLDAQLMNILIKGDPSSPEFAAAYAKAAEPRMQFDPQTGQIIPITPDMSVYRKPGTAAAGGAQQAQGEPGAPVIGKPIQAAAIKPTDTQAASALYADRATEAEAILSGDPTKGVPGVADEGASIMGRGREAVPFGLGNYGQSKGYQSFEQARRNFINAILRRESGAVISKEEFANGDKQYFPVPGDGPDVKAQKAANRATAIAGLHRMSGSYGQQGQGVLGPGSAPPPAAGGTAPDPQAIVDELRRRGVIK